MPEVSISPPKEGINITCIHTGKGIKEEINKRFLSYADMEIFLRYIFVDNN